MSFRKVLFWLHLIAGIVCGVIVAIMSFTGAVLVFEHDVIEWSQHAQTHFTPPAGEEPLSVDELVARANATEQPAQSLTFYRDEDRLLRVNFGRRDYQYLNPYTGELTAPEETAASGFMRTMMVWHRWLAMGGEQREVGKAITGASNLAFVVLIVTGIYLWWPRRWTSKVLRGQLWFRSVKGKARDFNWHNVLGFWAALPLLIFTLTAINWSYSWGRDFFTWLGGPQPEAPAFQLELTPEQLHQRPSPSAIVAAASTEVPTWSEIQLTLREGGGRGPGGGQGPRDGSGSGRAEGGPRPEGQPRQAPSGEGRRAEAPSGPQPIVVNVKDSKISFPASPSKLYLHPVTAEVLQLESAKDLPLRLKLRQSIRAIHTSTVAGPIGQVIGFLACVAALVLVWTGFALAWRRFFGKSKKKKAAAPKQEAPAAS
ncbi:MAG: PepSY-associated TM helix domain-containing protein [Verrucomicrobiota bacterium JB022]|nr:PepSY-associated TM helix domain-containing protein [Verrucomicrobiota bacterium JB022]